MKSRKHIVPDYLGRWQRETRASWGTIAHGVRAVYMQMNEPHDQLVQWSNHEDAHERMRLDAQILRRWLDRDEGLPGCLEEAAILALPDKYRQHCINELAARIGQHSGPQMGEVAAFQSMAHVTKDFGRLVHSMIPALIDGELTPADQPYVPQICESITALQGKLTAVMREIDERVVNHNVTSLHR